MLELNLPNLHYLHAIVKKNLCLHPSTPTTMPCVYIKKIQILRYKTLANTNVLVSILWAIGCDPKVWKKPLKFNSNQFFGLYINVGKSNYNLLPFGLGHQQCLGLNLQLIVQFVLATFFHAFDWSPQFGVKPKDMNMMEIYKGTCPIAKPF